MGSYNGGANRGYYLTANISWGEQQAGNNRTYAYVSINLTAQQNYFAGWSASGRLNVNGSDVQYYSGNYSMPGNYTTIGIGSWEGWVNHDANGAGSIAVFSDFDTAASPSYMPDYVAVGVVTEGAPVNYDRSPGSPAISVSRTTNSVVATLSAVSSPAGAATYYCQRSENGGAWGDQKSGQSLTYSSLALGSTQQFRSFATNSDGQSGYTYSSIVSIPNLPGAPASISATTPSALSTTISVGVAPDNGASVTGYFVQASADNGVTWGAPQTMTNRSYTFTALIPGATYKFRAYATNEIGNSAYATTPSTFVPAGGKRWNGLTFIATAIARRWNGTQWLDLTIAKRWTGSQWTDLS